MSFMKWYKFCLIKAYFDKGWAQTTYIKYGIALFGISSLNVKSTLIIGFLYGIFCFIFGWLWFYLGIIQAEIEVGNKFNLFVSEVRKKLIKPKNLNT